MTTPRGVNEVFAFHTDFEWPLTREESHYERHEAS